MITYENLQLYIIYKYIQVKDFCILYFIGRYISCILSCSAVAQLLFSLFFNFLNNYNLLVPIMDNGNTLQILDLYVINYNYVLFSWMLKLFKTGQNRDLDETDLYMTLDDHMSSSLGDKLEK